METMTQGLSMRNVPCRAIRLRLLTLGIGVFSGVMCGSAVPALAQACIGQGSFKGAPVQIGGNFGVNDKVKAIAGSLTVGADAFFVGAAIGKESVEGLTGNIVNLAFTAGSDLGSDRVHVCPLFGIFRTTGEHFGAIGTTNNGVTYGGSVGVVAAKGSAVSVIPYFGVSGVHNRVSVLETDIVRSSSFGVTSLGVGFVIGTFAISPHLAIPFSEGTLVEPNSFILSLSVNF